MYLDFIEAKGFRCFKELRLSELRHPDRSNGGVRYPNINVLLGDNAAGKSSSMAAIVLGILSDLLPNAGFRSTWNVCRTGKGRPRPAQISAGLQLHDLDEIWAKKKVFRTETTIELLGDTERLQGGPALARYRSAWQQRMYSRSPALFLAAYGTARQVESGGSFDERVRHQQFDHRYQAVASLFLPTFALVPLSAWLPDEERKDEALALLSALIPEDVRMLRMVADGELLFRSRGTDVPFPALSDGYRSFIGWVSDLLYRLCQACPPEVALDAFPGVVLVDEVDLFLHPRWQQQVVRTLSSALPRLQFVLTTHSPIVVGSLQKENIAILERDKRGFAAARPPDHDPFGLSPDQLLVSPLFDLETSRNKEFHAQLKSAEAEALKGGVDAAIRFQRMLALGEAGGKREGR